MHVVIRLNQKEQERKEKEWESNSTTRFRWKYASLKIFVACMNVRKLPCQITHIHMRIHVRVLTSLKLILASPSIPKGIGTTSTHAWGCFPRPRALSKKSTDCPLRSYILWRQLLYLVTSISTSSSHFKIDAVCVIGIIIQCMGPSTLEPAFSRNLVCSPVDTVRCFL